MRTRPSYTSEFKADAVALLARSDRSLPSVARDIGVSVASLRSWYEAAEMAKKKAKKQPLVLTPGVETNEQESPRDRIKRLERELAAAHREIDDLKMDREILKKAAAFFAKESE